MMFRKITLGLIAAAALTIAAAAPASAAPPANKAPPASGGGMPPASGGGFHHGGHWGHGWGYGGYGLGGLYINTGVSDCLQQQWVQTGRGMRLRTVNVCAY